MTGRITMLGLSRCARQGESYRTVQCLFSTVIPWAILFWVFFRQHVHCPDDVYLVAGDEVSVTNAGKHTHGLDRFFASLYGKPVPKQAFFTVALAPVCRSEEHTSELQSLTNLVCRLLLEKKK